MEHHTAMPMFTSVQNSGLPMSERDAKIIKNGNKEKRPYFFLTFQEPVKYRIGMKTQGKWNTASSYKQQIIALNEFGVKREKWTL